ncbi:ImmA/IrrE family metallo-endopeptidase [Streptomyces sp. NPDC002755]
MARGEARARELTGGYGASDLPVDPEQVARDLDALVVRQSTDSDVIGMLLRRDGHTIIGLNDRLPSERQRFALAHLAGHLHLHRRREILIDVVDRFSRGIVPSLPLDREEAEANRFAAELLAPEAAVRAMAADADFRTAVHLVELLAPRFGIAQPAMAARLMGLGIILDV